MNKEIVEMAEYVCDHICPMPEKIFDPEKLESYCNDKCNLKLYLSRALTESESTSLEVHRLTQKYRNVVLCTECVHADVYSGISSAERKRSRRRICTGSSVGNTWWTE